MEDIFGTIYSLFDGLFRQNLADHLGGYNCETKTYSNPNLFEQAGLATLGIALVVVFIYYYIINHPHFNRWWNWLIMLGITGFLGFVIGSCWTLRELSNGYIGDCYEGGIHESDCWGFGISNLFVAVIFFITSSIILLLVGRIFPNLASRNCKYSPF
jgi:hypothetical protein